MLLRTIGIAAQSERSYWLTALNKGQPQQIVEIPLYGDAAQVCVDAWLVVLQRTENPMNGVCQVVCVNGRPHAITLGADRQIGSPVDCGCAPSSVPGPSICG